MELKLIKVGNGNSEYPGNFTNREISIINNNIIAPTLHLFSGKSAIGDVRVDFTYGTIKKDVFDFLPYSLLSYKTVIIDAPYNQKFANKYQKISNTPKQFIIFADSKRTTILFNKIKEINPDIIILKSWNYYCLEGYKIKKCYICYPGGYRKSTFLIIMTKELIKQTRIGD